MSAHQTLRRVAAWCALTLASQPVSAQLAVYPVQGLTFGQLQVGVPLTIAPTNAARRAAFDVTGSGTFVLTTVLPTHLISGGGNTLPLSFAANSGRIHWRNFGIQLTFDPKSPYTLWLPWLAGGATVYLGGTASPGPTQAAGLYTATMTIIISNAGT
jgi:hypothetical protein